MRAGEMKRTCFDFAYLILNSYKLQPTWVTTVILHRYDTHWHSSHNCHYKPQKSNTVMFYRTQDAAEGRQMSLKRKHFCANKIYYKAFMKTWTWTTLVHRILKLSFKTHLTLYNRFSNIKLKKIDKSQKCMAIWARWNGRWPLV